MPLATGDLIGVAAARRPPLVLEQRIVGRARDARGRGKHLARRRAGGRAGIGLEHDAVARRHLAAADIHRRHELPGRACRGDEDVVERRLEGVLAALTGVARPQADGEAAVLALHGVVAVDRRQDRGAGEVDGVAGHLHRSAAAGIGHRRRGLRRAAIDQELKDQVAAGRRCPDAWRVQGLRGDDGAVALELEQHAAGPGHHLEEVGLVAGADETADLAHRRRRGQPGERIDRRPFDVEGLDVRRQRHARSGTRTRRYWRCRSRVPVETSSTTTRPPPAAVPIFTLVRSRPPSATGATKSRVPLTMWPVRPRNSPSGPGAVSPAPNWKFQFRLALLARKVPKPFAASAWKGSTVLSRPSSSMSGSLADAWVARCQRQDLAGADLGDPDGTARPLDEIERGAAGRRQRRDPLDSDAVRRELDQLQRAVERGGDQVARDLAVEGWSRCTPSGRWSRRRTAPAIAGRR